MIGGGLAGLSSAVALAEAGHRVRVVEKRPHLGGRATSYTLPDGSEVDNCQHVTLGCCTNLADFYRRVGAEGKIGYYDRLYFADARGRRSEIRGSLLPPPLHMGLSFLRFGSLTLADKRGIARALLTIARAGGRPRGADGISMLEWLQSMKQTPAAIHRFWRVVLVSALDEELAKAGASYGIDVFWHAFLGSRQGYRVGVPVVPLAELYEGCRGAIERRGGEVRLRSTIRQIRIENGKFGGAVLDGGEQMTADACIAAVPHQALIEMLPQGMSAQGGMFESLRRIKTSPITGVHLWFDRTVMREPFLALLDHVTQWIFNKTLLYAPNGRNAARHGNGANAANPVLQSRAGQYLQLVISASYDLIERSRQEIINMCLAELASVLPATREARLVKSAVIKEVHATFSPEPGVDQWRPPQGTGIQGLFVAGDWTRTGWPATMEGAVRSGYLAAEAVLSARGEARKFLQPDLPFEGLSRFWARRARGADGRPR